MARNACLSSVVLLHLTHHFPQLAALLPRPVARPIDQLHSDTSASADRTSCPEKQHLTFEIQTRLSLPSQLDTNDQPPRGGVPGRGRSRSGRGAVIVGRPEDTNGVLSCHYPLSILTRLSCWSRRHQTQVTSLLGRSARVMAFFLGLWVKAAQKV